MIPFFILAAVSASRQKAFRQLVAIHLFFLCAGFCLVIRGTSPRFFGQLLLIAGIIEGAILIGWRLTQLPRSQALEFLLVSPLSPRRVFFAEALVGLSWLAQVQLAGLPVLVFLVAFRFLAWIDLLPLLLMPFTWGALTGLGLTVWAYESLAIRRRAEKVMIGMILFYLCVGVLAGEKLSSWILWVQANSGLSATLGHWLQNGVASIHRYNPFAVLDFWLKEDLGVGQNPVIVLELVALGLATVLLIRGAGRLKKHFQERHYQPRIDRVRSPRPTMENQPLTWWAVRRVQEYSGRINLWLAGGFSLLFSLYTLAGESWPHYLGKEVFLILERQAGGIPGITSALVVLAAVPAAFQYGLWDSNTQDRCRRLELLLLTGLEARDYWRAALAAAWQRGRGYFMVAVLLWVVGAGSGKMTGVSAGMALASGVILWGFYFALGFQAFSRGLHSNHLGLLLTVGLPLVTVACYHFGGAGVAALLAPGSVFTAGAGYSGLPNLVGPLLGALATVALTRTGLAKCDGLLRSWYDRHQGNKVVS